MLRLFTFITDCENIRKQYAYIPPSLRKTSVFQSHSLFSFHSHLYVAYLLLQPLLYFFPASKRNTYLDEDAENNNGDSANSVIIMDPASCRL